MHVADIKAELEKRGYSQTRLAKELGLHVSHVHQVIHGTAVSLRVAKRIGQIIDRPLRDIWPGVYDDRAA